MPAPEKPQEQKPPPAPCKELAEWLPLLRVPIVLLALLATPARADLPVVDLGSLLAQAKSLLQQTQAYSAQLQQLSNEIQTVSNTAQIFTSLAHDPSLGGVMALAGQLGLSGSLPVNAGAVQSLMSGYGG